jgi:hypothetical protein
LFSGARETGVSPATSTDGFTVVRKTNAIHTERLSMREVEHK